MITKPGQKLALHRILPAGLQKDDVVFVCIGSDLSIGDSLGPISGTQLESLGYEVIGTLKKPLHGLNLDSRLAAELPEKQKIIIAIDACIGEKKSVGGFEIRKGPILPGKGLGKKLKKVGDYSIAGIVSSSGPFDFLKDEAIRLSFVMDMAQKITCEIDEFFTGNTNG